MVGDTDEADLGGEIGGHPRQVRLLDLADPAPGLEEAHHRGPSPELAQSDHAAVEGGHLQGRGRSALGGRQDPRRQRPALALLDGRGPGGGRGGWTGDSLLSAVLRRRAGAHDHDEQDKLDGPEAHGGASYRLYGNVPNAPHRVRCICA